VDRANGLRAAHEEKHLLLEEDLGALSGSGLRLRTGCRRKALEGLRAGDAVARQALPALEGKDGIARLRAVVAGHGARGVH
jgi:hypothetical protein